SPLLDNHSSLSFSFFYFNPTPTTEFYTLSLHDALPISLRSVHARAARRVRLRRDSRAGGGAHRAVRARHRRAHRRGRQGDVYLRSEEHTSELQSPYDLVCRLLLEKKKKKKSKDKKIKKK